MELQGAPTLWGLLINAGYLTVTGYFAESGLMTARIPNGEARGEFADIVAEQSRVSETRLRAMLSVRAGQNEE